jgi:hypothetical protein
MQTSILGATSLGRGELPAGVGIGYVYNWLRQGERKANEQRKKSKKLKKKIKKLTEGRKKEKRRVKKTRQSEAPESGLRKKRGIMKESANMCKKVPGQNDSQ